MASAKPVPPTPIARKAPLDVTGTQQLNGGTSAGFHPTLLPRHFAAQAQGRQAVAASAATLVNPAARLDHDQTTSAARANAALHPGQQQQELVDPVAAAVTATAAAAAARDRFDTPEGPVNPQK